MTPATGCGRATLLQAYTAFIYEGPRWPHRVQAWLVKRGSAA